MTIRIEPHNQRSAGARELSRATGVLRATNAQVARHGTFDTLINWGCSERRFQDAHYINDPEAVAVASDKLRSARAFESAGVRQPTFTTERATAESWFESGTAVMARRLLRSSQARGLSLHTPPEYNDGDRGGQPSRARPANTREESSSTITEAPLYTQYKKKSEEYRVHVAASTVINIQQKRRRGGLEREEINYQIRNVANGWVYCTSEVDCPSSVCDLAISAVGAVGLVFGAVDIGWNRHEAQGYVYEVNTAPGLEGSTIDCYRRAFIELLPVLQGGAYRRRRQA